MVKTWKFRNAALAALAAFVLVACGGGGGGGTSGDSGRLSLFVTDAPVHSVDQVWVTFDAIELKPQSGPAVRLELDPPVREDLLSLQGENAAALIEDVEVEAGPYNWIRLFVVSGEPVGEVAPSMVREDDGREYDLFVPGNQPPSRNPNQRFVQLSSPFVVPVNGDASFTIDVDLRQALIKKNIPAFGAFYMLRPSLRIVDNSETGVIYGEVAPTLACVSESDDDGIRNAVYVYSGFDVTPGDVYRDEDGEVIARESIAHPITTANVEFDPEDGSYRYTAGFLAPGDYTVAFTCHAGKDEPAEDNRDEVVFLQQHEVGLEARERVEQDFVDEG